MQVQPAHAALSRANLGLSLSAAPLFHAAWLFAAGIAATRWVWVPPSFALLALSLLAILCGFAAFRAQRAVWAPLALLWFLLGVWCAEMEPHPAPPSQLAQLSDGLLRTVEGTVVSSAALHGEIEPASGDSLWEDSFPRAPRLPPIEIPSQRPSQRIDLRVSSVEAVTDDADRQEPATGGVRLTVRWPPSTPEAAGPGAEEAFRCGDRLRAAVRLFPPPVYRDPGVWNLQEYLLDQGIASTAVVNVERVERIGVDPGLNFACRAGRMQHLASARLLSLPASMRGWPAFLRLSEEDAIMLAAMVAGDRTYLSHSLRVGFERTGSFHMLVVSGFHLAIVAGCIFWTARLVRLPSLPATLLTLLASFAYALFTGFAVPVQRSLWMVSLYLLGGLFYRQRSPLNTIGFAALCLLAISPRSLFDAGLQMTLLAVVSIGGVAAPLLEKSVHPYLAAARNLRLTAIDPSLEARLAQFRVLLRIFAEALQAAMPGRPGRAVAWRLFPWAVRSGLRSIELLTVSCVVELAMTLPMALYFHRITVFALPVNVFILPLLAILMPAALVAMLALFVWPAAASIPATAVAFFLHLGVGLVRAFGSAPVGDFRIPTPLLWQSAAFVALLGAAIALAHCRPRLHRAAWAALLLAALAAVCPPPLQHPRDALIVEAIDVGQGDSLLLITPEGKTLLVDGGGVGGGPRQATQRFDIGEEVVSQALWARGIRRLDAVALSHAHSDHMGGLPAVLRNFRPAELWLGNNPHFAEYDALLDEATALHVRLRALRAGDALTLGSARVLVLAPFAGYSPGAEPSNNDSLVLHVSYGETSAMLEGDAEAPIEEAMLAEDGLQSTLLKVGHHGSASSTRPAFLARVNPKWAVISCGLHNRYGHPRLEVLEELQTAGVRTYRTDLDGATCFRMNGKEVAPEPLCGRQPQP
jgi:competence protein ComEC